MTLTPLRLEDVVYRIITRQTCIDQVSNYLS